VILEPAFVVSAKFTPAQPLAAARYFAAGDTSVGFTPTADVFGPGDLCSRVATVKDRVREFLNTATSDTWFNFPEAFGIAVNLGYGSIYRLHESLGCSPIETKGFEIFMPGVLIEA
jgi:hypothetical protein